MLRRKDIAEVYRQVRLSGHPAAIHVAFELMVKSLSPLQLLVWHKLGCDGQTTSEIQARLDAVGKHLELNLLGNILYELEDCRLARREYIDSRFVWRVVYEGSDMGVHP